jgi:hypothetical protein
MVNSEHIKEKYQRDIRQENNALLNRTNRKLYIAQ